MRGLALHVAVFVAAVLAGRYAKRRRHRPAPVPPHLDAAAFVHALVEVPQQVLLVATRLQTDAFPRGGKRDARRSLGGAFDVGAVVRSSRAFARLWKRRKRSPGGAGTAAEARLAADEAAVALVRAADLDAGTATAALGYAAWNGLRKTCRALVRRGARLDYAPARDGLARSALHAAAARGFDGVFDDLRRAMRAAGASTNARDVFGYTARDLRRARPVDVVAEIDGSRFAPEDLERSIYGGAPLLVRNLARDWRAGNWSLAALAARDDVDVAPHPIPHGDAFGLPAPRPPTTLGAFVRRFAQIRGDAEPDYVFDAGDAAAKLFADVDVVERLDALLEPSALVDGRLAGVPARLHAEKHGRSSQFYAGPAGSGAPWHYHEHAVNVLLVGSKTWCARAVPSFCRCHVRPKKRYLLPPDTARYATAHPTRAKPPRHALVVKQAAGDLLFVPANWAHAVVNDADVAGAALEFVDGAMVHWMNTRLLGPHAEALHEDLRALDPLRDFR